MKPVERFSLAFNHQEADRVPIHDTLWPSTVERFRKEGMPADVEPGDYFGFEMVLIRPDITPRFPAEIIPEDEEYVLERTPYGGLRRQHRNHSSTPEILEWAIHDRADWERIKARLEPEPSRVDWDAARATYDRARAQGKFVAFFAHVGYAHFQEYIKSDELLVLLAQEPEWAKDMFATQAALVIGMAEIMVARGLQFDGAYIACDLGYRNATFFSPAMYRALQFPYDRQVFRWFRDRGMHVILHSDGRVKALIPQFLEAGISGLHPLEVKAGMDPIEIKRQYGRDLTLVGGIDVRAMADPDPQVIEDEIRRKLEVIKVGGGYIYHSDHSVPHDVSLERYRRVLDLVHRYGAYS